MFKISIITVCYNSIETIPDTLNSIEQQDYENIEYVVVDGGSTDGTVEYIERSGIVNRFVSEADNGIYDAMNKGIAIASGEIIGFLNADDFYANNHVLGLVAKAFEDPLVDACFADLVYVKQNDTDRVVRYWKSGSFKPGHFKHGWMPAHPTFFCRRYVYERYGLFDLNYNIAADVELLFRFLEKCRIRVVYLPVIFTKMRLGGKTNQSWKNIKVQNAEVLHALDEYYGHVSRTSFFFCKVINRLRQFLLRPKETTKKLNEQYKSTENNN
jgi:glycosyltransferase involved in cell wall biosynthesis